MTMMLTMKETAGPFDTHTVILRSEKTMLVSLTNHPIRLSP